MVSYYNHHFAMYQKNPSGANLPYSASPSAWYSPNYHQPPNPQFLGESDTSPQVYYPHHVFHQSSPDWSGHENYPAPPQSSLLQTSTANGSSGFLPINQTNNNHNHNHNNNNNNNANEHIPDGLQSIPSPPITVSGSDMSSPGAPNGSSSPQITTRPTPVKSPFEWMKKPSYQSQPNPGKTRTKDKYRVVYTDHQRLELEKEFHYTRYITIRRKSELAQALALSERQVKIWFQNRRAKDRKQKKKMENGSSLSSNGQSLLSGSHGNNNTSSNLSGLLDVKPKMEPSLHLQHLHHQMGAIGIGMSQMGLHHPHHPLHSHHLAPPPPLPPTSMNQTSTAQQGSAGSTASSLLLG